jgi:hypothetical protein
MNDPQPDSRRYCRDVAGIIQMNFFERPGSVDRIDRAPMPGQDEPLTCYQIDLTSPDGSRVRVTVQPLPPDGAQSQTQR